jgi:hypothetical protein
VFTEIGWSSHYPNGLYDQVYFLNRLPTLLQSIRPANVIWTLQYDLAGHFPGPLTGLNQLGLANNDGSPKPAWWQVLRLTQTGLFRTAPPTSP